MKITPGKLITFEGIDGCGKSTQAVKLKELLTENGSVVKIVREPGGTHVSEKVREILLNTENSELEKRTEALLMTASRAQLTKELIIPSLDNGIWVIADRYSDSTLAYQGGGRFLDINWLIELNNFATYNLVPDATYIVDVSPEVGFKRRSEVEDRIESEGLLFQANVRAKYLQLAERFPDRISVIDGEKPIDDIHKEIKQNLIEKEILVL